MKQITFRELQRKTWEQLREDIPFILTCDGQPVALVIDYAKYNVFARIKDVVEQAKAGTLAGTRRES